MLKTNFPTLTPQDLKCQILSHMIKQHSQLFFYYVETERPHSDYGTVLWGHNSIA